MNGFVELLKIIAALVNVGFGVFVVMRPEAIAKLSHFRLSGARGRSELRVLAGGFFIGLGIGALLLGSVFGGGNAAYQVVGFAWLAGALVRLLNLIIEEQTDITDRSYLIFLAFEVVIGGVLLLP